MSFDTPQSSVLERLLLVGIIGVLIFASLAFGSIHVWAYTMVEIGVFSLLFLHLINQILFSGYRGIYWVKTPVNAVLVGFILLICLQIVPLPSSLIAFISPKTFADKIQILDLFEKIGDEEYFRWMTLAYYIHPTIQEGLRLLTYLGIFFLVLNTVKTKKQMDAFIYVLIFLGIFQTIYAVTFQCFAVRPVVWWWEKSWRGVKEASDFHAASGTFIGSNHFAFYMEMLLSLCFGFMIAQKKAKKRLHSASDGFRPIVRRIVKLFSPESSAPKMIFLFVCCIFIGMGFLFSNSRGGILSMGIAMSVISVLFFFKKNHRKYGAMISGLLIITMIYAAHAGIQPIIEKFRDTRGPYLRLYTTSTIFPMIADYPLFGAGWGNFAHLYPRYIPKYVPEGFEGISTSGYSHNDWVEATAEVGLAGGVLMLAALCGYLYYVIRIWLKRNDFYAVGIGAGVIMLLISTGIHSFFDFSMHIPANPLTLGAIAGLGYVAIHHKQNGYGGTFFYEIREIPLNGIRQIFMAGLVFFFFLVIMLGVCRHFLAEIRCPTEWNSTLKLNWNPDRADIQKAISLNPGNAEYYFKLAKYHMRRRYTGTEDSLKEFNDQAIINLEAGLRLNPTQGYQWHNLGECYALKRHYDTDDALNDRWLPLADQSFDIGIRYNPNNIYVLTKVAEYWVWRSSLISETEEADQKKDGIRKFQGLYKTVLGTEPERWKRAVEEIWQYYPDAEILAGIVPTDATALKPLISQWVKENKKP